MPEPLMLGARSHYSFGESLLSPKDIADIAADKGYEAASLADTMSVSGMVEFIKACNEREIKYVIGCRLRIVKEIKLKGKDAKQQSTFYPKVFAKNSEGMSDIMNLLTLANDEDHFDKVPRLTFIDLFSALEKQNLIFMTGDLESIFHMIGPEFHYKDMLNTLNAALPIDQFYLEYVPIDNMLFRSINKRLENYHQYENNKTVYKTGNMLFTYPCLYRSRQDAHTLTILGGIVNRAKLTDKWCAKNTVGDFCLEDIPRDLAVVRYNLRNVVPGSGISPQDMVDIQQMRLSEILNLCRYEWKKLEPSMPKMADDEYQTLINKCVLGWSKRIVHTYLGHKPDQSELPVYKERLAHELNVLHSMKFERYFLLVEDIVSHAKSEGIMVGPGRGSIGGSLIAFLLGLTDVDPIRFDLLFERFINPDRIDLPDADLDFMSSRRGEVIDYIIAKYKKENVAAIRNYSKLGSASALRDTGRIYGLLPNQLDASKRILKIHGVSQTLEESEEKSPEIGEFRKQFPMVWEQACKLQGVLKNMSQHAAGIIIADEPIANRAVVEQQRGNAICNWDKRTVEDWGLVKIDILGLSALDVIRIAIDKIKQNHGVDVDLTDVDLHDPDILYQFEKLNTVGIFQFASNGMKNIIKKLSENGNLTFDDLVAVIALFRPGPLDAGLVDDYIDIKQGNKIPSYDHPNMMNALKPTNSVIVYQEQVMQLARDLAGFTIVEADHLRKAMGKKDKVMMAKQRDQWVKGCRIHSSMAFDEASALFDKIEVFAGYAFNKSHSVEYAIIGFWTMWLKHNYMAEFYAASLTIVDDDQMIYNIVLDAKRNNIKLLPPDINHSTNQFETLNGNLLAPFKSVKFLTERSGNMILEKRKEGGPFASLEDFEKRIEKRLCNVKARDIMERIGCFVPITKNAKPVDDPDRLKDQHEFMKGYIVTAIKSNRSMKLTKTTKQKVLNIADEMQLCKDCDLNHKFHPIMTAGKDAKFMVITDYPSFSEESKMLEGNGSTYLRMAIYHAGLTTDEGYFTAFVKAKKEGDNLTNDQINSCHKFLDREIAVVKPTTIIALGKNICTYLSPDNAVGYFADYSGKIVYDARLDANIILGFNPMMIYHDPDKQDMLNQIFEIAGELIK